MELLHLKGGTYLLPGPTNVGVYIEDGRCWLVDTPDERRTRDLVHHLESLGYTVEGVFLTHFHVDHTRGCARIQKMREVPVYAPIGEISMVSFPILEGYMLYGAHPPRKLRKGFFESKPSRAQPLENAPGILESVKLPGHTLDHTGFLTPDGILFSGDAYFGEKILSKYPYPYLTDVDQALSSLDRLLMVDAVYYVPSHGELTDDPSGAVKAQREAIERAIGEILSLLSEPKTLEDLVASLGYAVGTELGMWFLARSFVAAVISYLNDKGEVCYSMESGKITWKRC